MDSILDTTSPLVGARILVTGGHGFLGTHLVNRLAGIGCDMVITSRRSAAGAATLCVDLSDRQLVESALRGQNFDYVVHAAGVIDQGTRPGIYAEQVGSHVLATLNLVESLEKASLRRFVQIGSNAEYGQAPCPQSASGPVFPNSAYGVTKLAATSLILAKAASEGLPASVLRPFLIYGTGQPERSFFASALRAAKAGAELSTTLGLQTRDFIPVDWVVNDILRVLCQDGAEGAAFNSCTGHPITIREVLEVMVKLRPGFRPHFGIVPYRNSELMESHGVPLTPVSLEQARETLEHFIQEALA